QRTCNAIGEPDRGRIRSGPDHEGVLELAARARVDEIDPRPQPAIGDPAERRNPGPPPRAGPPEIADDPALPANPDRSHPPRADELLPDLGAPLAQRERDPARAEVDRRANPLQVVGGGTLDLAPVLDKRKGQTRERGM